MDTSFFAGVHDLHRTFFLFPIIYAALIFRQRGSLVASFAFLCIVLPRAVYLSPYPNPLLRPLISVVSSFIIGTLVAAWHHQLEVERKDKRKLSAAYDEVRIYGKRLEENQEMLIQAEKLASMGQLAASIAHEVNNPLSGVLVYVQLMKKKLAKGDVETSTLLDYLTKIDFEITRSTKLIRNLLDFSSQSKPNIEDVDCNEVLSKVLDLAIHARSIDAHVETQLGVLPKIRTDPDQLQEVLINLVINGFQAMPGGGTLTVRTDVENQEVRIAVQDTGCGIPPGEYEQTFHSIFQHKERRQRGWSRSSRKLRDHAASQREDRGRKHGGKGEHLHRLHSRMNRRPSSFSRFPKHEKAHRCGGGLFRIHACRSTRSVHHDAGAASECRGFVDGNGFFCLFRVFVRIGAGQRHILRDQLLAKRGEIDISHADTLAEERAAAVPAASPKATQ